MPDIRKLIALCLTDPVAAIAFTQQIPESLGKAHALVRAVANYNPTLASQLPDDPIILDEIADEISAALKRVEIGDYLHEQLSNLDPMLRNRMVDCLRRAILPEDKALIQRSVAKDPDTWWFRYHHGWGTSIRNLLRDCGFSERETGISNLDDVYVQLIELAVKEER